MYNEVLIGDRIIISPVDIEDAHIYYKEFNDEVTKFQFATPFNSLEEAEALINNFIDLSYENINTMFNILDRDKNFIGSIELYELYKDYPEVGIWICKDDRNKGYAEEALRVLINYFKDKSYIKGFIYEADIRNIPSLKLIEKIKGEKVDFNKVKVDGKELQLEKYVISFNK